MMSVLKNRSRQEIIKDILCVFEEVPEPKTRIMYRASLSYTQLKYYGEYLMGKGLIEVADEKWRLTEKGKKYLKVCKMAEQILEV